MEVIPGRLAGLLVIEPVVHGDQRGFFLESYRAERLRAEGLTIEWVQDNHSRSRLGTIRGMHFQPGQAKLVRCARGVIFDVACDLRRSSPTFGQWEGYRLDDESHHQLLIPDGFAHGFCVLSETADVVYKTSAYYDPAAEAGFRFDDPEVGIEWPLDGPATVSERDRSAPSLRDLPSSALPGQ